LQSESNHRSGERASGVVDLGPFRIDFDKRLLLRDGCRVPLTPKAFDVLDYMVANPGRLLSKQELMDAVWSDTHVEEGNLARTISSLRRALDESPDEHRFIVTVPGLGYRFVGETREPARDLRLVETAVEADPAPGVELAGSRTDSTITERAEWGESGPPRRLHESAGSVRRWLAVAVLVGAIGVALGLGRETDSDPTRPARRARLSIPLPEAGRVTLHDSPVSRIAIAPDGQRIVVAMGGSGPLRVRTLDDLELRELEGTSGGTQPFFSPDGRWVAFFTLDGALRKVPPEGGKPIDVVTGLAGARWSSGVWLNDGHIVFAPEAGGVFRVSGDGGSIESVFEREGRSFATPTVVPGTELLLLTERTSTPDRIVWLDLSTGESGVLSERAWDPRVTTTAHVLFARDRTVHAAKLAKDRRSLIGTAVPVPEAIAFDHPMVAASQPQFAVSTEGTLAYLRPLGDQTIPEELVSIDLDSGKQEPIGTIAAEGSLALSADGTRLLTTALKHDRLIVDLLDLTRGTTTRLVEAPAVVTGPAIWMPATSDFLYPETSRGVGRILRAPSDGSRAPEVVLEEKTTLAITPWSVSPAGVLAYTVSSKQTGVDVRFHSFGDGGSESLDFLAGPADERQPAFSPDGKWIAYESNELEGQFDVFVRRFPSGAGKRRVSTAPFSVAPLWSADGTELFFMQWGGTFLAVDIEAGEDLSIGAPRVLFRSPGRSPMDLGPKYAVDPTGGRLLFPLPNPAVVRAAEVVVVQDWLSELDRLVPAQ
jgi:DNA-binding winged helix-turn-helix (wHTH) protein/Tol biopolymer transport system component